MSSKIVLAYSGGLDTTAIVPWLLENYRREVLAVCVDVGQGLELNGLEQRAKAAGVSAFLLIDAKEEFVRDYAFPMLQSGAIYEGDYLLGTAIARPLIANKLVEIALREGVDTICHGATGKGNDQVRFELAIQALAPRIRRLAPWREWSMKSREDVMAFLRQRQIACPVEIGQTYSRDGNAWHLSHEGQELENPACAPCYESLLQRVTPPWKAPEAGMTLSISFEKGIPVALDGENLPPYLLLAKINELAGAHGIGIVDLVENRLIGMKSRGVYETPGGTALHRAHHLLEQLCLDRETMEFKGFVAQKLARIIYDGQWFTPLREALFDFVRRTQQSVSGEVRLRFYRGNIISLGAKSPHSLYDQSLASFATGELFHHADAKGFIELFGLPSKVRALHCQQIGKDGDCL